MCVERNDTKRTKCYKLLSLISIFILVVGMLLMVGCSKLTRETIDINQYVVAELDGYDGYGSVVFNIDYEELFNDTQVSDEIKLEAVGIATTYDPFVAEYQSSDTLKNEDTVEVVWQPNQDAVKAIENLLKIKFQYDNYTYTVIGLEAVVEYNPFDDLYFDTHQTKSGNGEIDFSIHCCAGEQEIVWDAAHNGENGAIKNGDILTLTIENDIDMETFTRSTGLKITQTTDEYAVMCLCETATDATILNRIGDKEKAAFDQVIENWVVSGLNDENVSAKDRTYELLGYMFYTNADLDAESMLIAIYTINDTHIPEDYYVFIGLEGVFSFDYNGVYINNGEDLPTSFIYYEKETIRYSEKFGWGQNCEPMGFLYNDVAYAGHMDLHETLEYLDTNYGEKYSQRFVGPWFDDISEK